MKSCQKCGGKTAFSLQSRGRKRGTERGRHTGKPAERSSSYNLSGGNQHTAAGQPQPQDHNLAGGTQQLAEICDPADARCSGRRSELVDGLASFCTEHNTERPAHDVWCSGGRSAVDGLVPFYTRRVEDSLGVGSCGRPPEMSSRDEFAPTLVPSATARPSERSSLYHSAGRNQQSVATMASYPAGENQHHKSSG